MGVLMMARLLNCSSKNFHSFINTFLSHGYKEQENNKSQKAKRKGDV